MRYIFVIQGEGRGHMTQAISLASILRSNGHEIVGVLIGKCENREIPQFFIDKIKAPVSSFDAPAVDYGRKGRQGSVWRSILFGSAPSKTIKFLGSIRKIALYIRNNEADVVVNFYDMMLGITAMMGLVKRPIISIAHQYLIDHPQYKLHEELKVERNALKIMNKFCAHGSKKILALSLYHLPECTKKRITVVPPLLRKDILSLDVERQNFTLGYMLNPAFLDDVLRWKEQNPEEIVHLFWDKKDEEKVKEVAPGLWMHQLDDEAFMEMMARCKAYITTAGFESLCEAAYLEKPVMMIPSHFEQKLNAADAKWAGVGIISDKYDISQLISYIPQHKGVGEGYKAWTQSASALYLKELESI